MLAHNQGKRSLSSRSTMLNNYSLSPSTTLRSGPNSLHTTIYIVRLYPANKHIGFCFLYDVALSVALLHPSQGYEDWLRHKADCSINECPVDVVQQGKVVRTQSHKLRVRMASLDEHSTRGSEAALRYCSVAHFFPSALFPRPSLCSPVNFVSFLSSTRFSLLPVNCPETVTAEQLVCPASLCRSLWRMAAPGFRS